ncbi:MAG TPA: hypothetical protein VLI54_03730 [Bacillota bacterium]|nr:hypothetical protein [Bacillota bacterium]
MKISFANQKKNSLYLTILIVLSLPFWIYFGDWLWVAFWASVAIAGCLEYMHKWYYVQRLLPAITTTANLLIHNFYDGIASGVWVLSAIWAVIIVSIIKDPRRKEYGAQAHS